VAIPDLDRACREIEQQLPPPHHHRCVTLRKSDYRKAEGEIKRHLRSCDCNVQCA
jgi:hypothetical protein